MTLIIGDSGTGKSTSIRNLAPVETYVINVIDKPLPFREFKKHYTLHTKDVKGNYMSTDDYEKIIGIIRHINNERPEITNLVLDDFQYIMAHEYMRNADQTGFSKFSEMANQAWKVLNEFSLCRETLNCFILSHNQIKEDGKSRCKTIGKLLDDKIDVHARFTTVLHTTLAEGQYKFLTQTDGIRIAKSPLGMFEERLIENDLNFVRQSIDNYYLT